MKGTKGMVRYTRWPVSAPGIRNIALSVLSAAVLSACGGGGGGGSDNGGVVNNNSGAGGGSNTAAGGDSGGSTPTPVKKSGTVTGTVSYDFVPTVTSAAASGDLKARLDYGRTYRRPVRSALVEIMSEDGATVIGKTFTNEAGVYSIDVPADTRVYVRVTAQGMSGADGAPDYLIKVRDNTAPEYRRAPSSAPLYSIRGDAFTTATSGSQAELNAASGWTGNGYGAARSAAPFAILDQLVTAAQKMHDAAPEVALPALNVYWSVNNRPGDGDIANGLIRSSHYDPNASTKGLYLLGAENVDTDEYDASVVVHEFGHYLEYALSRSDSFGGSHYQGDALDMSVAFSEAFGNAFSSMVRDSPIYSDTMGALQSEDGFGFDLDTPSDVWSFPAWFDETALGNALYGLYKSPDIRFAPIYRAMLNGQKNTPAFTSIFSFATALRPLVGDAGKAALDASLSKVQVNGGTLLDAWGTATVKGNWDPTPVDSAILPIYAALKPGGSASSCTTTIFGGGNKLGNFGHLRLTIPATGVYKLTLSPQSGGPAIGDYAITAYSAGAKITPAFTSAGSSTYTFLAAGDYAAYVAPRSNSDFNAARTNSAGCVNVSLQAGM
jgi:hypothetical protein